MTSNSSYPSIGNGTIKGLYCLSGNNIDVSIFLTMGSTTSFGSGSYRWSIPFLFYQPGNEEQPLGNIWMVRQGTGYHTLMIRQITGQRYVSGYLGSGNGGLIGAAAPASWGDGDIFNLSIRASI